MIDVNDMVGWQDILSAAEKNEKLPPNRFGYDVLAYSCLRMVLNAFSKGEFSEAGKNKLVGSVYNAWCECARQMAEALETGITLEVKNAVN